MTEANQVTKEKQTSYKVYWTVWFVLLILTVVMIFIGSASIARAVVVPLLLAAMLMKASLIGGYFMHLRFERLALVLTVVVGILFTAAALYFLIIPDGIRILKLSSQ